MQSRRISSAGPAWRAPLAQLVRCVALLAVLAAPLGACSSLRQPVRQGRRVAPDEPPEKLYNEGVFLLDKRQDYKAAAKKFEEVERQHPYSDWARKSLIMVGLRAIRGEGLRRVHLGRAALRDAASRQLRTRPTRSS